MLKPLHKNVVIKIAEQERQTSSGLVLPSSANEVDNVGEVVALGEQVEASIGLEIGDRVVFDITEATGIGVNGEDYQIITATHILAVIN